MNDMYAMTVLGNLSTLLAIIAVLLVFSGTVIYCSIMLDTSEYDIQEEKEVQRRGKIRAKRLLITGIISLLLCCFVPSTKEMYAIYGIGGIIDYVKGNGDAKKLPAEVIDALDKYFDEQKGGEQ